MPLLLLFSDEEDAGGDSGAFDYELETAKRARAAVNGSDNAAEVARAVESEQEKLEGMSERLQTETKASADFKGSVVRAICTISMGSEDLATRI